jgi:hypothetical protein
MVCSQAYMLWFWTNAFMWRHAFNAIPHNSNNVGLHTFVHGDKSYLKITLKLKGTKLGTSRNVGKQKCLIICN